MLCIYYIGVFYSLLIHVSFSCMPDYYGDDCGVHCKVEGNIEKCDESGAVCKEGKNTLFIVFITKLSQKIYSLNRLHN